MHCATPSRSRGSSKTSVVYPMYRVLHRQGALTSFLKRQCCLVPTILPVLDISRNFSSQPRNPKLTFHPHSTRVNSTKTDERLRTTKPLLLCPQCGSTLQFTTGISSAADELHPPPPQAQDDNVVVRCRNCQLNFAIVKTNAAAAAAAAKSTKKSKNRFKPLLRSGSGASKPPSTTHHTPLQQQQFLLQHSGREPQEEEEARETVPERKKTSPATVLTPKQIYAGLNKYVIGQDQVKKILSVGVYNHYKRLRVAQDHLVYQQRLLESQTSDMLDQHAFIEERNSIKLLEKMERQYRKSLEKAKADGSSSSDDVDVLLRQMERHPEARSTKVGPSDIFMPPEPIELDKTNIMVLGPTGSGTIFECVTPWFVTINTSCIQVKPSWPRHSRNS